MCVRLLSGPEFHSRRVLGSGASWDSVGDGSRLALATDASLYIVTVRSPRVWAVTHNTLAYVNVRLPKCPQLHFWNFATDQMVTKSSKYVTGICSSDRHFLLAAETDHSGQHSLIICNSIGTPVVSKMIDFVPTCLTVTDIYVIATDGCLMFLWAYCTTQVLFLFVVSSEYSCELCKHNLCLERAGQVDNDRSRFLWTKRQSLHCTDARRHTSCCRFARKMASRALSGFRRNTGYLCV